MSTPLVTDAPSPKAARVTFGVIGAVVLIMGVIVGRYHADIQLTEPASTFAQRWNCRYLNARSSILFRIKNFNCLPCPRRQRRPALRYPSLALRGSARSAGRHLFRRLFVRLKRDLH